MAGLRLKFVQCASPQTVMQFAKMQFAGVAARHDALGMWKLKADIKDEKQIL